MAPSCWSRESSTAEQNLPDPVVTYLTAIDAAEANDGAYAAELGDLYLGLGQSLLELKDYEEAKVAYQRGLQVQRINYGLYSMEQVAYLFSIADIESITGDWKSTENILENIYVITSNSFEPNDVAALPALDKLLKWYLVNYKARLGTDAYLNLQRAESLAAEMAAIIEYNNGLSSPATIKILRQLGHLHYFMAEHLNMQGESINPKREFNSSSAFPGVATRPPIIDVLLQDGIRNFSKLIDAVDQQQGSTTLQRANTRAKLGDWHLIFGQRQTATKHYQEAYRVLVQSSDQNLADEVFGQPTLVDFSDGEGSFSVEVPESESTEIMQFSMTVTNSGKPQDITLIDAPENLEKKQIDRLERDMRSLAFRPRLADGKPVLTKEFILDFPVDYSALVQ